MYNSDISLLKSLVGNPGVNQEELEKALSKEGLVQVQKQVTRNGKTFTRLQWERSGDAEPSQADKASAAKYEAQEKKVKDLADKIQSLREKFVDESAQTRYKDTNPPSFYALSEAKKKYKREKNALDKMEKPKTKVEKPADGPDEEMPF